MQEYDYKKFDMMKNVNDETEVIDKDDVEVIVEDKNQVDNSPKTANVVSKKQTVSVVDDLEENLVEKYKDYKMLDIKAFKKFLLETKDFLFGITLEKSKYIEVNEKEISKQIKTPIKFGLLAIAIALGFFGIWSGVAPLDSASIAEGFVKLSANKKTIQHYEGGIVDQILVKDGDEVKKGQVLVILNEAKTKSDLERTLWQLRYDTIFDRRLTKSLELLSSYHNGSDKNVEDIMVGFENKYIDKSEPKVLSLIKAQQNTFNSYKAFVESSMKTFSTQVEQIKAEIKSVEQRISSHKESMNTLEKEYERKQKLYEKKLETAERLNDVKIKLQNYKGQILEDEAKLAGLQHKITEYKTKQTNFIDEQNVRLAQEHKQNHIDLLAMEAQYIHTKNAHERTVITAPNAGIITDLKVHTIGGAVPPNGQLMDIIPQDDNLIIEAFIPSNEIDSIHIDSPVKIQLNAYKARLVPRIEGKVVYISADRFEKEIHGVVSPGQPRFAPAGFYKARIEVAPEEIARINTEVKLYPGMPVTAFIVKGSRSLAGYLYSPIKDSFHKAFKEP